MKKRVLIVCTGNCCRSQMAEGLWRHLAGDEWDVYSAGTMPAGYVYPLAIQVLGELDIDISAQESQHVDEYADQEFDLVITVCDHAREECPVMPGAAKMLHWPFEDPTWTMGDEETRLKAFRQTRNQIADTIRDYLDLQ